MVILYFNSHFRYKRSSNSIINLCARSGYHRGGNIFRLSEKKDKRAGKEKPERFCGMLLSSLFNNYSPKAR